jgi:hypothetical protein
VGGRDTSACRSSTVVRRAHTSASSRLVSALACTSPDQGKRLRARALTRPSTVGTDALVMTIFDVMAIVSLVVIMLVWDATSRSSGADRRNLDLNSRTYPPILPVAP